MCAAGSLFSTLWREGSGVLKKTMDACTGLELVPIKQTPLQQNSERCENKNEQAQGRRAQKEGVRALDCNTELPIAANGLAAHCLRAPLSQARPLSHMHPLHFTPNPAAQGLKSLSIRQASVNHRFFSKTSFSSAQGKRLKGKGALVSDWEIGLLAQMRPFPSHRRTHFPYCQPSFPIPVPSNIPVTSLLRSFRSVLSLLPPPSPNQSGPQHPGGRPRTPALIHRFRS